MTEGHVPAGVPGDVEAVRLRIAVRIAVGVGHRDQDELAAARDHRAADVDRFGGESVRGRLDRPRETQHLLHGVVDETEVGSQCGQLVRVREQGQHTVGDQVHRGLVAGDEQQPGHAHQFTCREPVALLVGGVDQCAHQVVAGLFALVVEECGEKAGHLGGRGPARPGVDRGHRDVGPLAKAAAVQERHAEQFTDDGHGQREGQRLDEIGPAVRARQHGVEQFVRHLLDARDEFLHPAGGELPGHELAQPGVRRCVRAEHGGPRGDLADAEGGRGVAPLLGEPLVRERGPALLVPDDQPGVRALRDPDPVDGAAGP